MRGKKWKFVKTKTKNKNKAEIRVCLKIKMAAMGGLDVKDKEGAWVLNQNYLNKTKTKWKQKVKACKMSKKWVLKCFKFAWFN